MQMSCWGHLFPPLVPISSSQMFWVSIWGSFSLCLCDRLRLTQTLWTWYWNCVDNLNAVIKQSSYVVLCADTKPDRVLDFTAVAPRLWTCWAVLFVKFFTRYFTSTIFGIFRRSPWHPIRFTMIRYMTQLHRTTKGSLHMVFILLVYYPILM